MVNSILVYDYEELDEFIVPDYFSKKVDTYSIISEFSDNDIANYFSLYKITDNDKLERISYDIYGTTDFWDILLTLNDRNPLFDMPYDTDAILDISEKFWANYADNLYFQAPLDSQVLIDLVDIEIEKNKVLNEVHRYIYIIKPSKIHDFIKILREKDYIL